MSTIGHKREESHVTGFTLVEMIVAMGITGIVLTSMVATFITFAMGARSISAYTDMSNDSRIILENFARDMRAAEDVTMATASKLVVVFPDTTKYGSAEITYDYDSASKLLFRIEEDKNGNEVTNEVLLEGVEQFEFSYYNPLGDPLSLTTPSILLSVKSVQINAEMLREISRTDATDYIISARFLMRNRPVTD